MERDERLAQFYHFSHEDDKTEEGSHSWDPAKRYENFEKIGQGGMKTIFKAYDTHGDREVAYAKVREDIAVKYRTTFIQEAKLTASLEHPNIITIHDIGLEKDGSPFFTMELKVGDSLGDILKALKKQDQDYIHNFQLDQLLDIYLKVCDAVAFAHSKGIMHLDLKPENIQVGKFGEVLVCDWGLSKTIDGRTEGDEDVDLGKESIKGLTTLYGDIKGTPGYMAPEQINPDLVISYKSDIYALGVILYEILCLNTPFKGAVDDVLKQTLTASWDSPLLVNKNLSSSLSAVVMKAMSLESESRYEKVEDIEVELQNFRHGFATQAEQASTLKLLHLLFKRHQTLVTVLLVNFLVGLFGTLYFINEVKESESKAILAQNKAEEHLKLAKEQEALVFKTTKYLYIKEIQHRQKFFEWSDYNKFSGTLTKSINQLLGLSNVYPNLEEVNAELGYLYFVKQDFVKSKKYLVKYTGQYLYILELLDELIELKGDRKSLSADEFCDLMEQIKPFKALHTKLLYSYLVNAGDIEKKCQVIKAFLKLLNPNWTDQVFVYDSESRVLKIGGKNFHELGWKGAISIMGLKLRELDVSDTELQSLNFFKQLNINTLYIQGTKVTDLTDLNHEMIRKVVVSKNQLDEVRVKERFPSLIIRKK